MLTYVALLLGPKICSTITPAIIAYQSLNIISVSKHPFTHNPDPNLQNAEVFVYALSLCVVQPIHHLYAGISIGIIE